MWFIKGGLTWLFMAELAHSEKLSTCSGLMKTELNNVVLPTLFIVVNNVETVLLSLNQV